ncbi:MAG TPA: substrate-binding domain-containing protein, partial [Spirochaetia bacterium]
GTPAVNDIVARRNTVLERTGKLAAELVHDGDVVYLDAEVESATLVEALKQKKSCTIITNSLYFATRLGPYNEMKVYILGGRIDPDTMSVGTEERTLAGWLGENRNISVSFMGALGLTPEAGFSDSRSDAIALKAEVLKRARVKVVIMDSGRWGNVSLCTFARPGEIDVVVTDDDAPAAMLDFLSSCRTRAVRPGRRGRAVKERYARFESLREAARAGGSYPGQPCAGRRIAFANGMGEESFCVDLEKSFVEHALRAGFARRDIHTFDNRYDAETALRNCDEILALEPDVFVEFQVHSRANNIVAGKCVQKGVPILGLETPVPSATFIGPNNWQAGIRGGEHASGLVATKLGGIDSIDLLVLIQMATDVEVNLFRTEGFAAAFLGAFGEGVEGRIVRETAESNTREGARRAMDAVLSRHPGARNMVVTTINHECMQGVIDSLRSAGRFDPGRLILVSYGCDDIGRRQIRDGEVDGSVAFFPERYGEYILPAVCALLEAQPLPPYIYIDTELITADNVREYYPET